MSSLIFLSVFLLLSILWIFSKISSVSLIFIYFSVLNFIDFLPLLFPSFFLLWVYVLFFWVLEVRVQIVDLAFSLFKCMHLVLKFLCKYCLNCIPQISMFYFHLISVQCIFNYFWGIFNSWIFFLVVSYLVSNCLKTLLLSFCYWYSVSLHCVQRITVWFFFWC